MAKSRMILKSNFRLAARAGREAVSDAIQKGTEEMHEEASRRLDNAAGARGYNLYSTDIDLEISDKDGEIRYTKWYGKFFEYGTPTIPAMPFMRPGHRKGRKKFLDEIGDNLEKKIKRKAGL